MKPFFLLYFGLHGCPSFSLLLLTAPFYHVPEQTLETDQVRNEGSFTHPPTELNRKRTQTFLKMGDSKNTKATILLKAIKSSSVLSPYHNRATLHPLLSHAWGHPPLASPSVCQLPEEPSRLTGLTQAVQITKTKAPVVWLLWRMVNANSVFSVHDPETLAVMMEDKQW